MITKGKEVLDFAAEKLDICLKKKQSGSELAFLMGKDVFVSLPTQRCMRVHNIGGGGW